MLTVKILVFDGFDELDAIAPWEVLRCAETMGADLQIQLVTLDPPKQIIAAHGLRIISDAQLDTTEKIDLLIVPGGGWASQSATGVKAEVERGQIPALIAHYHQQGTAIAAVCTGSLLLAASGILKDRPAITHQSAIDALREYGANITWERVVDDGDVITSGGVTSGLDLALWLIERYFSPAIAQQVEKRLEYKRCYRLDL